jgi:serine/threonine-protein kinase RsbW
MIVHYLYLKLNEVIGIVKIKRDEYILYGLEKYKEVIDKIIADIQAFHEDFNIRVMLTEALTNAFKHGNNSSSDKPIYLRYIYNGKIIKFEIEDSGTGVGNITILDEMSDENLLRDSGRGLFLIKSMTDKMEFVGNTLIIQTKINTIKNKC